MFDDGSNNVWYDDQGRPHITVTPNAPIGPLANPLPVDVSNLQDYADTLPSPTSNPLPTHWPYVQTAGEKAASILTGGNGQERYQLFPERIVRSALSLPTDVASGKVQTPISGGNKVLSSDEDSQDELLQRVQDMAALMGGGGVAMAPKAGLGTAAAKLVQPTVKAETAPIFHSAVENAVNTASLKAANPDQWLGTISNAKGVKPEELEWTGLRDWLKEQEGPVSKEQVQEFLQQNKVELKEVNKNSTEYSHTRLVEINNRLNDIHNEFDSLAKQPDSTEIAQRKQDLTNEKANLYQESKRIQVDNSTKYYKWQLPGGSDYKEKLLTLPNDTGALKVVKNEDGMFNIVDQKGNVQKLGSMGGTFGSENTALEVLRSETGIGNNYKSSHWDEANILAHIRMNDRTIEGKPALHIEEIQSDWHQQGREHGYKITDKQKQQLEGIENKLTSKLSEADIGNPDMDAVLKTAIDKKVITAQEASNYKQWSKGENSNIPDAPFKKTWLDLAAKRMIREAAEQGKDVLSWTPGEAQAARYDLSKQIKEISHTRNPKTVATGYKGETTYDVAATTHKGEDVTIPNASKMTEKDLEDTFGKEIAKKIINDEGVKYRGREFKTLEGLDLKVGGEGMHYFYDKMLPAVLEKLTGQKMKVGKGGTEKGGIGQWKYEGPELTADQVMEARHGRPITSSIDAQLRDIAKAINEGKTTAEAIESTGSFASAERVGGKLTPVDKSIPVNYIDLPQHVKDTALHKGFPLFSSGLMLSPTEDNPFKNYKLTPVEGNPFEEKK